MSWKIDKFQISYGDNLRVWSRSTARCVFQIKCESPKINDWDIGLSRQTCYLNFVDDEPPEGICFPAEIYPEPFPNDVPGYVCCFSFNVDQFDYFFSILTTTDVYLSIDENKQKLTKVIAKSIDRTPPQVIASDPPDDTHVDINKVVRIVLNDDIQQADEYENISLTYIDRNGNSVSEEIDKFIERNVLTIKPSDGVLTNGKIYTLTLPKNSVQDLSENSLTKKFTTTFTTFFKPPK